MDKQSTPKARFSASERAPDYLVWTSLKHSHSHRVCSTALELLISPLAMHVSYVAGAMLHILEYIILCLSSTQKQSRQRR